MPLHSNMFGWDYVWRDFAESNKGKVVTEDKVDGDILALVVPAASGASLTITPTSNGTSVVLEFEATSDFVFSLYREKPLHQISKAFGMQDIVIGAKDFDSHFIIKANNEAALRQILIDATLRDLILTEETEDLRILHARSGFDPRWAVRPKHSVIAYSRPVLIDKLDHLSNVCQMLCLIATHLERLTLTGQRPIAEGGLAEVAPTEDQHTSRKLHSPLLDRK